MDGEIIVGAIIMCVVCCGCGALFFGLGVWANRLEKPMHFWSGSSIDPKTVIDIPEYNRKNAVMWKWYSLPYWLAFSVCLAGKMNGGCMFRLRFC